MSKKNQDILTQPNSIYKQLVIIQTRPSVLKLNMSLLIFHHHLNKSIKEVLSAIEAYNTKQGGFL